ncbi:MAG: ArsR family transcriptional regulator, partial [Methylobacterium radiotolerans]
LDFTESMERWYGQMLNVPRGTLAKLIRLGGRIVKFLPAKAE